MLTKEKQAAYLVKARKTLMTCSGLPDIDTIVNLDIALQPMPMVFSRLLIAGELTRTRLLDFLQKAVGAAMLLPVDSEGTRYCECLKDSDFAMRCFHVGQAFMYDIPGAFFTWENSPYTHHPRAMRGIRNALPIVSELEACEREYARNGYTNPKANASIRKKLKIPG